MTTRKPKQTKKPVGLTQVKTSSPARERERKDHVLQARVPHSLYKDLVTRARQLRVPVSNLVRNILEDSTRMVENIVDGGLQIAETLSRGETEPDLSSVLGWQPMTANRRLACSRCGGDIEKGQEAHMSVGAPDGRVLVICPGCKEEI